MSRFHWKRSLFMLAQIIAGAGFIFSSVWLRHDFRQAPGFVKDAIVTLNHSDSDLGVISSRVLKVPLKPAEFTPLGFEVETKQFRFELEPGTPVPAKKARKPSSLALWHLHAIRRQLTEKDWEEVELIRDEQNQVSGSVFVELDDGKNSFSLVYKNDRGEERERVVNIRHQSL